MNAKIVETDGKKTAVELFKVEPSMSVVTVELGSRESYARLTTVEIPKGEYLALTEKIDCKAYDYAVTIYFGEARRYHTTYYLYNLKDLRKALK